MRRPEAVFRSALCKKLRDHYPDGIVQPIESEGTGLGIPDIYISVDGVSAWIECKADLEGVWPCERKIDFRPLQYSWNRRNASGGGISTVAIKYSNAYLFIHIKDVDSAAMRPVASSSLIQKTLNAEGIITWLKQFRTTR